jgi:RNA polymerase sigma factor (sigma-70 family)
MKFLKLFSTNISTYSDLELIAHFQENGDNRYVGELFNRYTHLVFGVCLKYLKDPDESQDAVMLIFEKLLTDLKRFEIQNFPPWLHRLTQNYCLMMLRQKEKHLKDSQNLEKNVYDNVETPQIEHLFEENLPEEPLNNVEAALANLKDEQRTCLMLFYMEQKSYQEIAEQTRLSLKEVKSHIQNGRRNIKKQLGILSWFLLLGNFFHF